MTRLSLAAAFLGATLLALPALAESDHDKPLKAARIVPASSDLVIQEGLQRELSGRYRRVAFQVPAYRGRRDSNFFAPAVAAARRNGVPEDLFLRLVTQESGWNPSARSGSGAIGLTQLMPGTARHLQIDPRDPVQNLEGGARYLRQMHDRFGTWTHAVAAYNAGPGNVARHRGVPPFSETRNYVRKVLGI